MRALLCLVFATTLLACGERIRPAPTADAGSDASLPVDAGSDAGDLTDAGSDAGDPCLGTAACWQCPPTTNVQFLNRCTEAECAPFDNATRIPDFGP